MIIGRRRSRVVGAIWGLVALAFLAAAVLLWIDDRRVSFEVPSMIAAALLARTWGRQRAELDRHGINTRGGVGEHRLLWAGISKVEVRRTSWIRPGIVLHPKGEGAPMPVPASAGLRRRQRNRLLEFLSDLSRQHGFALVTVNGDVLSSTGPEPLADVRSRVMAAAAGEPIFAAAAVPDGTAVADGAERSDDPVAAEQATSTPVGTTTSTIDGAAPDVAGREDATVDHADGSADDRTRDDADGHADGTADDRTRDDADGLVDEPAGVAAAPGRSLHPETPPWLRADSAGTAAVTSLDPT